MRLQVGHATGTLHLKKVMIGQSIIVQLFSFDLFRAYFGMALRGFEHRGHSIHLDTISPE
jgi:hypothetical protein